MRQSLEHYLKSVCRLLLVLFVITDNSIYTHASPLMKPKQLANQKKQVVMVPSSFSSDHLNSISLSRGGESIMSVQDKAIVGAGSLLILDTIVRKAFRANKIGFPAQLGGCILLFLTMVLSEAFFPGMGDSIFHSLTPGAALLTKWLPVFFVPGLAMLPLAPSIGTTRDHVLVLSVVVLGFYFSCSTVAFSVQLLRQVTTKNKIASTKAVTIPDTSSKPKVLGKPREKKAASQVQLPPPPPPVVKQFLQSTLNSLAIASLVSGVISIVATRKQFQYATSLQAVFHFISTVTAYVWASLLPPSFTKFVHPLVTSTTLTWLLMQLTALATDSTFKTVLATYKAGSLHWSNCGAGDHLLNLLGPSVIAFAVAMYSRKKLLQENLAIVLIAMLVSAGGGLFGTAAFVRAIQLGGKNGALVRLSVLSRNVTTALAIAVTSILGGNISIASSVVVLTGIFAATFGRSILTSMGIHDPVARGLGIGGAGQGLGVASMSLEPDAFPFAAMSMVLTAVCATILVSIPAVKDVLVQLAVGP